MSATVVRLSPVHHSHDWMLMRSLAEVAAPVLQRVGNPLFHSSFCVCPTCVDLRSKSLAVANIALGNGCDFMVIVATSSVLGGAKLPYLRGVTN